MPSLPVMTAPAARRLSTTLADEVGEDLAASGGRHAFGVEEILDGDGDALQRTTVHAASKIGVGGLGGGKGAVFHEAQEGIQLRLQMAGTVERLPQQFTAG
jgi:hypothetical protein